MKMRPGAQTGFLMCGKEWTDGELIEVRSPWDQGLVGRVTQPARNDARQAVTHSVASLRRTRALPRWKRSEILREVAAALRAQSTRFEQLIVAEAGRPIRQARVEIERSARLFELAAQETMRFGDEALPLDLTEGNEGRTGLIRRHAIGPVLAVTPSSSPLALVAHKLAPAIAVGCPVLLKPSLQTPFTALALGEIILKTAWPDEALAILPLSNADTSWLIEKEERIKLLSFTGSARVGWELKSQCVRKRAILEHGGNSAMIVHSDWQEIDSMAARSAVAAFNHAGQSCISLQRIYVHRPIFQTFLWKIVERAARMAPGDPALESTEVGPMVSIKEAERVDEWVKEAVAAGAKLVQGGERKGALMQPTILTSTKPGMKVHDEEVFGPVLLIEAYDDFEDALAAVNHSRYGLQAGLLTRDIGRIQTAFRELEVGALIVGDTPGWRAESMPFGGVKDSGMGREGIPAAMLELTEPKLLSLPGVG
jgi:acyl-CoA reductase-like NAD-dependent aldehyde dehydrogenase